MGGGLVVVLHSPSMVKLMMPLTQAGADVCDGDEEFVFSVLKCGETIFFVKVRCAIFGVNNDIGKGEG